MLVHATEPHIAHDMLVEQFFLNNICWKLFVSLTVTCNCYWAVDEAKTRFAVVVKARARKKFLAVRNLRPRQAELQAPPFVGLEWDGQPEVIPVQPGFRGASFP